MMISEKPAKNDSRGVQFPNLLHISGSRDINNAKPGISTYKSVKTIRYIPWSLITRNADKPIIINIEITAITAEATLIPFFSALSI